MCPPKTGSQITGRVKIGSIEVMLPGNWLVGDSPSSNVALFASMKHLGINIIWYASMGSSWAQEEIHAIRLA